MCKLHSGQAGESLEGANTQLINLCNIYGFILSIAWALFNRQNRNIIVIYLGNKGNISGIVKNGQDRGLLKQDSYSKCVWPLIPLNSGIQLIVNCMAGLQAATFEKLALTER